MRVKVSSKNQIAVPAEARKQLDIQVGDYLLAEIRDGVLVLMPEPSRYSEFMRGLHREVWADIETRSYLQRERAAWQE